MHFLHLKEGTTWIPELLFIDLDLADFNSKQKVIRNSIE